MMAVDPVTMPFWLQRGTAFVIFAAAVFMIAAHSAIAAMAAQYTSSKTRTAFPFVVAGFLAAWLAIAIVVGDALTGILAPVVASLVARNRPHALRWAVAW